SGLRLLESGPASSGVRLQPSSSQPVAPPPLATGHTTVILQRRRVAGAAVLFGVLIAGVAVLAYTAMRNTVVPSELTPPPAPRPVRPSKAPAPAPPIVPVS